MNRWRLPLVNDHLVHCKTTIALVVRPSACRRPNLLGLYAEITTVSKLLMCSFTAGSQQTMSVHGIVRAEVLRLAPWRLHVPRRGWGQTTLVSACGNTAPRTLLYGGAEQSFATQYIPTVALINTLV
ncbi:unnamed protein product [Pieris macdunnoughi]|uniref:Uncharacterized protein n=1 Tax=Pieris macdunnoughi TaxID=345717 RepID=A0A821XCD0_9NEOP|nr:unnamed protein product [Pieris macdunnoughi]